VAAGHNLCSLYHDGLSDLLGPAGPLDLYDLSGLLHPEAACLLGLALDSHAFVTGQVAALCHRHWGCSFGPVLEDLAEAAGPALMRIARMAVERRAAVLE
jgi:hypothetical protein